MFVAEFVQVGGEFETVGELTAKDDVRWRQPCGVCGRVPVGEKGANNFVGSRSPLAFVLSLIMRLADLTAASARPLL